MNQLLYEYLASKGRYFRFKESAFSLENGEGQLKQVFEDVAIEVFHDRLEVDDAEAIVAYHQSFNDMHEGFMVLPDEEADGFRKYLKSILQEKQTIGVAKISGIFVCQK
jgi:hypothetical protein